MAGYISTGAFIDGKRPKSKAELKRALAADLKSVSFEVTDLMGPHAGNIYQADELPTDVKISVVGPDPQRLRNWYGTVTVGRDDSVKVV